MKRVDLKQGTIAWEKARQTRIGSSEVFDIVRYYATETELLNCGLDPMQVLDEMPYTTAWALYHKMMQDGIFVREALAPELADYGHAVEPYGMRFLQKGRKRKLSRGIVYCDEKLIASLDVSGISEEIDLKRFDYGIGNVPINAKFVCEQKSINPAVFKKGLPIKHIVQAQYQISSTKRDFYILELMVLKNDTVFERGKITAMSPKKRNEYLDNNMDVYILYFQNNEALAKLIDVCLYRFFSDVSMQIEPAAFLESDTQRNIIQSIRINTFFNRNLVVEYDLSEYLQCKENEEKAEALRMDALQKIIDTAMDNNAVRFVGKNGWTASFSARGAFLTKPPRGDVSD